MADDALMRKNAEMGKMTEARLAWARECGRNNLPCPSDRELDAFNEGFRRAQALSLESVREEALEDICLTIQKVVSDYTRRTPAHLRDSDVLTGHIVPALLSTAAPESPPHTQ